MRGNFYMQNHEEWLLIAEKDLKSAYQLALDDFLCSVALYHTQQSAEKALKGYLVYKNQPIKRVHDLVILIEDCAKLDFSFTALLSKASTLKLYITQSRDPDDYVEPSQDDVKNALKDAKYIFEFVKNKVSNAKCNFE